MEIAPEDRDIPAEVVCYSNVLKTFLDYLDSYKQSVGSKFSINTKVKEINSKVHTRIYGKFEQPAVKTPPSEPPKTEEIQVSLIASSHMPNQEVVSPREVISGH